MENNNQEIDELIKQFSKLPGLGPKSAKRIILKLITNKENMIKPLAKSLASVYKNVIRCNECGNLKMKDEQCICKKNINNISINGHISKRLPANLNISIPGINSDKLIKNLKNTVISTGSACTSNNIEASYVLSGMGLSKEVVNSSIRIGIGRYTTKKDINNAIKDITDTVKKLR